MNTVVSAILLYGETMTPKGKKRGNSGLCVYSMLGAKKARLLAFKALMKLFPSHTFIRGSPINQVTQVKLSERELFRGLKQYFNGPTTTWSKGEISRKDRTLFKTSNRSELSQKLLVLRRIRMALSYEAHFLSLDGANDLGVKVIFL